MFVQRFATQDTIEHRLLLVRRARTHSAARDSSDSRAAFALDENGLGNMAACGKRKRLHDDLASGTLGDGSQTAVSALTPDELAFVIGLRTS